MAFAPGCLLGSREGKFSDESLAHYTAVATELEMPNVETERSPDALGAMAPLTIRNDKPPEYWNLSLEEAMQTAIANSQVLRDLGGAVIRAPGAVESVYAPAVVETDPRFGVDAALSAFDAQFNVLTDFANNDRALNNELLGGGTRLLKQELFNFRAEVLKRSATGGEFAVRKNVGYDANNAPSNLFPHAYNANIEFDARQPLLQGAGSLFNRIAGAEVNGRNRNLARFPGDYNGVLIARINTDVQLADLEMALRDLVSNVENTYWDLYYAYRDLDAKLAARDAALETWRRVHALYEANRRGGEAEKEAQAREQYFQFQEEVENALTGRLLDGTRTNNGSRGGTFRGAGGVHVVERRLRLLMGISLSDGRLARPSDEPTLARVAFDWPDLVNEALCRRAELRRQKWVIKRRELELIASRNFLMPRLDAFGQYRFRGFGNNLIDANTAGRPRFDNAYQDLTTGDFQEWNLGLEFSLPIGFRLAHTGVRNAELQLSREQAVLKEQERQIIHDLADIVADMDRAFTVAQTAFNRREAAKEQYEAVQAAYDADKAPLDQVLSAQRTLADSDERFHRALVEYALAVKNVHFEKGSLLDHNQVYLAEGPWPGKAYFDAARREQNRGQEKKMDFTLRMTPPVSSGPVAQETEPSLGAEFQSEVVEEFLEGEEVTPADDQGSPFQDDPLAPPAEMPAAPEGKSDSSRQRKPSSVLNRLTGGSQSSFTTEVEDAKAGGELRLPGESAPVESAENPPDPYAVGRFRPLQAVRGILQETISTVVISPDEEPTRGALPASKTATTGTTSAGNSAGLSPSPIRLSRPLEVITEELGLHTEASTKAAPRASGGVSRGAVSPESQLRLDAPSLSEGGRSREFESATPSRAAAEKPSSFRR